VSAELPVSQLVDVFELEGRVLDATLRRHPRLHPLFTQDFSGISLESLKQAYLSLLKLKADYVRHTVPALRAAGHALAGGDAEDQAWSQLFLGYASGETDEKGDYGHHIWALEDMRALGAPSEMVEAPPHPTTDLYGKFFVEEAVRHPYAILGAKGVLEHFSIRVSDDVVAGVLASGIPNAAKAVSFFEHHGVLDIDHVREGDRNLERLSTAAKRFQVLEGAYFTSGIYRSLVRYLLPT
jgi:hypothetical protein